MLEIAVQDILPLALHGFVASWTTPLDNHISPAWLTDLLHLDAKAPLAATEDVRTAVRQLLRTGGYKPSGRGKPSSEYLARAAAEQTLASINLAVDLCNVVSLHSGLPISVVDLERTKSPFRIDIPTEDVSYVFNASGQEIRIRGLMCLYDQDGPCACPVKDSQRTKTHSGTTRVLCIVWGMSAMPSHGEQALAWYRALTERAGGRIEPIALARPG